MLKQYLSTLTLFILFSHFLIAQQGVKYHRAKIHFEPERILELAALGLDLDHGDHHHAKHESHNDNESHIVSDFADYEIASARAAGFEVEILIEDVQKFYTDQNIGKSPTIDRSGANSRYLENCAKPSLYDIPQNFELGSMGGYYTYEEMIEILDQMSAEYPDLITVKEPINSSVTHEGRPVYWLKISDNPNVDENEPELMYNSLTHAREPNSLTQNIYFMWYLLENYATNEEVKYLVDNTEMYFVPCVNPDGYIFNQVNNPNGGGLWRKNRRDNGDGTFGVDINRNYGFQWGFDDFGSSGNTNSQVYRGTAPFSEPETQMIREFCNAHEFIIALNCHTFSNLLLYPFSFSDANAEAETFVPIADLMTSANDYEPGWGTEVLGYPVNGDAVDWQYGEQTEKNKIYAFVPEVGPVDYGFWPPMDEIVRVTQTALEQNIYAAHLALHYAELEETSGDIVNTTTNQVTYELNRLGLTEGSITVSLEGLTDNVVSVDDPAVFTLGEFESVVGLMEYTLADNIVPGERFSLKISWSNGQYTWSKTMDKYFGEEVIVVDDPVNIGSPWTTSLGNNSWGTTFSPFYSAPAAFASSPFGNYTSNQNTWAEYSEVIDLADATAAYLSFATRWRLEKARDYVQVEVSREGENTYEALCGKYTKTGSPFQDEGPIYDGYQLQWLEEEMDLSEYLGDQIRIRFRLATNSGFFNDEGFYFDDFKVTKVVEEVLSTDEELDPFTLKQNQPNPADDYTIIQIEESIQQGARLLIFDVNGQAKLNSEINDSTIRVYTKNWASGIYFYQIETQNGLSKALKMSVQH